MEETSWWGDSDGGGFALSQNFDQRPFALNWSWEVGEAPQRIIWRAGERRLELVQVKTSQGSTLVGYHRGIYRGDALEQSLPEALAPKSEGVELWFREDLGKEPPLLNLRLVTDDGIHVLLLNLNGENRGTFPLENHQNPQGWEFSSPENMHFFNLYFRSTHFAAGQWSPMEATVTRGRLSHRGGGLDRSSVDAGEGSRILLAEPLCDGSRIDFLMERPLDLEYLGVDLMGDDGSEWLRTRLGALHFPDVVWAAPGLGDPLETTVGGPWWLVVERKGNSIWLSSGNAKVGPVEFTGQGDARLAFRAGRGDFAVKKLRVSWAGALGHDLARPTGPLMRHWDGAFDGVSERGSWMAPKKLVHKEVLPPQHRARFSSARLSASNVGTRQRLRWENEKASLELMLMALDGGWELQLLHNDKLVDRRDLKWRKVEPTIDFSREGISFFLGGELWQKLPGEDQAWTLIVEKESKGVPLWESWTWR